MAEFFASHDHKQPAHSPKQMIPHMASLTCKLRANVSYICIDIHTADVPHGMSFQAKILFTLILVSAI